MDYFGLLVLCIAFTTPRAIPFFERSINQRLYHKVGDMIGASWIFEKAAVLSAMEQHGKWSNGVVIYEIKDGFTEAYKLKILEAMQEIESVSCIRFQPHNRELPEETFTTIWNDDDCSSTVGTFWDEEDLRISLNETKCVSLGVIIHELMHTLGFDHEHQRRDRDDFIKVHFENIEEDSEESYIITANTLVQTPYDYESIMHYDDLEGSKNGNKAFTPIKDLKGKEIGQEDGLSKYDMVKINRYYQCFEDNSLCKDKLSNCDELSMKQWYCEEHPEDVVLENCAKTCGMCRYF